MQAKRSNKVEFEVCSNSKSVVVIKRVLPGENSRQKFEKEMKLPKVELQCLDSESIERFLSLGDFPFSTVYEPVVPAASVSFKSFFNIILKKISNGKSRVFGG